LLLLSASDSETFDFYVLIFSPIHSTLRSSLFFHDQPRNWLFIPLTSPANIFCPHCFPDIFFHYYPFHSILSLILAFPSLLLILPPMLEYRHGTFVTKISSLSFRVRPLGYFSVASGAWWLSRHLNRWE
jgi:hypothetical protein